MKIILISVGPLKKPYIRQGVGEYLARIKRYFPVETVDVRDEPSPANMPVAEVLKREGQRIEKKLRPTDFIFALSEAGRKDEGGKSGGRGAGAGKKDGRACGPLTSRGFAALLERVFSGGRKRVCFIVGGAFGLDPSLTGRADAVLSLSPMTMAHELARLVLAEQIYRALTIIRGEPYSH